MDFLKDLFHSFIPNQENDYKPHFFRVRAVAVTAAIIVALALGAFTIQAVIITNFEYLAAVVASTLVDLTNGDRSANGLQHLKVNPVLQKAAELKAADMAAKSYFAHNSPEGLTPWHWFREANYDFAYAGENLATYFSDSIDVERAWMNSPGHRANILNEHFTEIGIATAEGSYNGVPTVFVVQMFGTPAAPQPVVVEVPETETEPAPAPNQPSTVAGTSTSPTVSTTTPSAPIAPTSSPKVTITTTPIPATTSVPVLGSSAEEIPLPEVDPLTKVLVEDETFIAVKKTPAPQPEPEPAAIASVATAETSVSLVQKFATSPRSSVSVILFGLAAVIGVALALMIGIEVKRQHPLNIAYGIALLALIGAIIWLWQVAFPGTTVV